VLDMTRINWHNSDRNRSDAKRTCLF
jgi:hypothetical protein